jgi:hypothetical protein
VDPSADAQRPIHVRRGRARLPLGNPLNVHEVVEHFLWGTLDLERDLDADHRGSV